MEKHIKQLVIPIICLSVFMCAGSGRRVAEPDLARKIIGEWEWVESFGGFAGEHRTPETEGYTKTYVFRADHTFLHYRDGTLVFSAEYRIVEKAVWKRDRAKVLEIEEMTDKVIGFDGTDTLGLTGHCPDCFSEVFIRINTD